MLTTVSHRLIYKRQFDFTKLEVSLNGSGDGQHSTYLGSYKLTWLTVLSELEKSTQMFAQLADPNGANNALSQVLYGLALR